MHVAHLSLTDYRSYPGLELALQPGVTTFVGPNGHGKTNLIEAIGYVATLGSHRVAQDAPLVRFGAQRAIVRASVVASDRPTLVELEINPGRANRARLNRAAASRPRDVLGVLRTVLFAPEDLALVKGDPAERRRLLDDLLVARAPRYAAVRADYERVLKQRNALLRSAAQAMGRGRGAALPTLDVWDHHLATTGTALILARIGLISALEPLVDKAYTTLAGGGGAVLSYRSTVGCDVLPTEQDALVEAFLRALTDARDNELSRGVTQVGPHRDELLLGLRQHGTTMPAKGYASHGESWSYALALRLAGYELLCLDGGEPVLLLDDVFAELDTVRRSRLAELIVGAEQTLVTAAVAEDVPASLAGARFDVSNGEVHAGD